ncbi:MAG: hypothetical protein KDI06_07530 [Calditrichaeota bacterium]|nr:hypothetical protein [Calditrichota bacterium]HQU73812.1 hypothetical protein [Calditrichia bacterium]
MDRHPHEAYFYRNRGEWRWRAEFRLKNRKALLKSGLARLHRYRYLSMLLVQKVFGPFYLKTEVDYREGEGRVRHTSRFGKWGICFFLSEKTFLFLPDGEGLRLDCREAFWPRLSAFTVYEDLQGRVSSDATGATYQMPFLGEVCTFQARLDGKIGRIAFQNDWGSGEFVLKETSLAKLRSRFNNP